jgi:hypothetical protein
MNYYTIKTNLHNPVILFKIINGKTLVSVVWINSTGNWYAIFHKPLIHSNLEFRNQTLKEIENECRFILQENGWVELPHHLKTML